MNVCMISYSFYESDNRVMRYAEALAARGDTVDVISLRHEGQQREEVLNGVHVLRIQARQKNERNKFSYLSRILLFLVRAMAVVAARHLRQRYAVVHVHSVPDFMVFAAVVPRLTGAKLILDIHDLLPELYGSKFSSSSKLKLFGTLQKIEKTSAACAHHVIAPNHIWHEKLISRSVSAEKSSVFMNYPDPTIFCRQGTSRFQNKQKFIIVYPGTLNRHQGLDVAIRAFARISDEVPNADFHIYGEGPAREELMSLADSLKLSGRVVFHAPVPLRQVPAVIEGADLGIVAKRNDPFGDEAFSTKTLEFMMLGVPIILAETTVDRYYFNDDVVTFFPNGDAEALAACMMRLIKDPGLRIQQAARATAFVAAYSWGVKKGEYLSLVDKLAGVSTQVERLTPSRLDVS